MRNKNKPLSPDQFFPDDQLFPVEGAFRIVLPIQPCRKAYLSFFRELSVQIYKQIVQKTGRKPDPYLNMCFNLRFDSVAFTGEPYIQIVKGYELCYDYYTDRMVQLHYNGYAYAEIGFGNRLGESFAGYPWIRWKSLRPEYEYIDHDSGLELTEKDIVFEICTELPAYIVKQAESLYREPEFKVDCNSWIEIMRNWKDILPPELFLPYGEHFKYRGAFTLTTPLLPCRKAYEPFFKELCLQVSKQITQLTGKKPDKYMFMCLFSKFSDRKAYKGELYVCQNSQDSGISDRYSNDMIKLHCNGYSYAEVGLACDKLNASNPGYFWIRWKSLRPEYEYIDYDCGLELTDKDICFEICTELPEEIAKKAESLYRSPKFKVDCNSWIDSLKNGTYLPKPRKKLPKNTKPMFPYDLSEGCAYPDVFYTLWFESGITDGLKERVEAAFVNFMDIWNEKHEEDAIHDIADAADIIEVRADAICYAVDFGNADPKAVINLLKHLHNGDLGISKAVVS